MGKKSVEKREKEGRVQGLALTKWEGGLKK